MTSLGSRLAPGVIVQDDLQLLFAQAKADRFALPAVNVVSSNGMNTVMETAREVNSPVILQFSSSGAAFVAGKGLDNGGMRASIAGAIAGARHVHELAEHYGARVVLHTDHCAKKLLPWVDGLLDAGERHFAATGKPLFSSHMLDLSEEPLEENIDICRRYLERMSKLGMTLEIELGVTGGEEDGVDNSDVDSARLYTQPSEVAYAYEKERLGTGDKPVDFVFHGGSGSSLEEIREAISYGVVKMNIDTDLQWAFWDGVRGYYGEKQDYLQGQIGNPKGPDEPNKKFYDPRVWLRAAEVTMQARLRKAFEDLDNVNRLG